jgi:long-chain acyl-CoA synthetase
MFNLSVLVEDTARRRPDRDAVVLGDARVNYKTLNTKANQVANLLVSRGIEPGDKVPLSCPNLPQFPTVYYAILKDWRSRPSSMAMYS